MTDRLTEQVIKLFSLNDDQRKAATESGRDVVVTAGAGSGKTSTLVARYACLLAKGTKPRQIAAITFTIKAAMEMRSRVRSTLMQLQENALIQEERLYWSELSTQIDSARIGTIHSLCAEIIRNHPAEAGVDPRFEMLDEGLTSVLRVQVVKDTLAELIEEERFLPLLFNMPLSDLSKTLKILLDRRLETKEAFQVPLDNKTCLIREFNKHIFSLEFTALINQLRGMSPQELKKDAGEKLADAVTELLSCWSIVEKSLQEDDPVNCAIYLFEARRNYLKGNIGKKDGIVKPIVTELRQLFDAHINHITGGKAKADVPPSQETEALFDQLLPLLRDAFDRVHYAYLSQLERRHALDFDDLEFHAHRLLEMPEVREHWQKELDAIMVDEYQDTNPRQRNIVNALAGDRGCLFMVGDMRQSIYRFRGADVTVFKEEQERIDKAGGLLIGLDRTYRAHEELLNPTGDLLSAVIGTQKDPKRKYYVPYTPLVADKKTPSSPVKPPHVEFVVGAGEDTAEAKQRSGQALAVRLQELQQEGQIKNWDEVALLFRAATGYPYYEEALEDAGIPFMTVAGKGFYDRPEIRDLLNILRAIADPLDDLAFAGLLRSPAFGLSDAALFQLRQLDIPYWDALQGDLGDLSDQDRYSAKRVLRILNLLIPIVDRVPVAELLKRVIDEVDYRAMLATVDIGAEDGKASKAGGRLWRNVDKLLADTQLSQAVTVREFLGMLETLNDAGAREGEAPTEAKGSVRLMTIHKSKGLQYPIVILADAGRGKPSSRDILYLSDEFGVTFKLDPSPMLFRLAKFSDGDQDDCEDLRVLYVALTRAQSKLIISSHATYDSSGLVKMPGWAGTLDEALGFPSLEYSKRSGEAFITHTGNNYPVRAVCMLEAPQGNSLRTKAEIPKQPEVSDQPPLYKAVEDTGRVDLPDEQEKIQELQSWHITQFDGPVSGKVLGLIVHKALQRWLFPGDPALLTLLESEAWMAGLVTEGMRQEVVAHASDLLVRFRGHHLWQVINLAQERYSELPYSYMVGHKVENRVIDLLYRDVNGWHIVDFKSDHISTLAQKDQLVQLYAPQVRQYKAVVSSKLGQAVSGQLCFLDDQGKVTLVEV